LQVSQPQTLHKVLSLFLALDFFVISLYPDGDTYGLTQLDVPCCYLSNSSNIPFFPYNHVDYIPFPLSNVYRYLVFIYDYRYHIWAQKIINPDTAQTGKSTSYIRMAYEIRDVSAS
jgi:hypothetical protein